MRILLFGDGEWASNSLRRLMESGHECAGVVLRTQPSESGLTEFCRAQNLRSLSPERVNTPDFLEVVKQLRPDLNISISYNQILRRPLIESTPLGFINFHAGMLPRYRGRNVINWAIINGEPEIGITSHYVDEGIDTGDIILQRRLPIAWTDGYGDVLDRVVEAFPDVVLETVNSLAAGTAVRRPQDHSQATYMPGRVPGDEWLDWRETSLNLYNKIRGITRPGPGARTLHNGTQVTVWSASYDLSWPRYIAIPGAVVGRSEEGVFVKTVDSTLLVREVQQVGGETGRPRWPVGTRLG